MKCKYQMKKSNGFIYCGIIAEREIKGNRSIYEIPYCALRSRLTIRITQLDSTEYYKLCDKRDI